MNNDSTHPVGRPSANGFRIVSMYVGDFDCLKHQMLQFCSDYMTSILHPRGETVRLKVESQQVLPIDFFSLGEGNEGCGCVNSVSAIIGKNGSGKTTLARLFCNLPASDDRKSAWRVVLIYELNGVLKACSTFQHVEINNGSVECAVDPHFTWPYRFFYYSPHFTTEQFDTYTVGYHSDRQTHEEGENVSDISTTGLLLHPEGNSELLLRGGSLQSSIFDTDEKIRLFEFIACCYETNKLFLPTKPDAIAIGIHVEGFRSAVRDIKEKVESCRREESGMQKQSYSTLKSSPDELRNPVGEYLRALIGPFGRFQDQPDRYGAIVAIFMCYAARYIQECGMFNPSFPVELLRSGYLPSLREFIVNDGWTDEERIKRFLKTHFPRQDRRDRGSDNIPKDNPWLELVELLQKFCKCSDEQAKLSRPMIRLDKTQIVLHCRLDDDNVVKDVCRLVMLHGRARMISSFMKFDVLPHMSSGEMSFLTLFARLYRFVGQVPKGENVVVFLDEVETTLHPEWQRRLVACCIRFFEMFLPNRHYQLLFASHSPMLLSDVPRGNVVFLQKHEPTEGKEIKGEKCLDAGKLHPVKVNTFAANIFDLYKDSFFLDRGTMGEFAVGKVNKLLAKLNPKREDIESDEKYRQVGKDVRGSIDEIDLKIAMLIGDPFLSRHIWHRLEESYKSVDDPEDELSVEDDGVEVRGPKS